MTPLSPSFVGVLDSFNDTSVAFVCRSAGFVEVFLHTVKLVFDMAALRSLLVLCLVCALVFEGCEACRRGGGRGGSRGGGGNGYTRYTCRSRRCVTSVDDTPRRLLLNSRTGGHTKFIPMLKTDLCMQPPSPFDVTQTF
ncbi:hypothetical protein LSAT2_012878 [Lamellibrachia satsuma]|nr:hypothetical protein LSAT2_012878 [Lamellibrachia satsuma]